MPAPTSRTRSPDRNLGELHQLGEGRRLHQVARSRSRRRRSRCLRRYRRAAAAGRRRTASRGTASIASRMAGLVTSVVRTCPSTILSRSSEKSAFMSPVCPSRPRPSNARFHSALARRLRAAAQADEGSGGLARNRTGVQGFAVLCVTTPPRGLAAAGVLRLALLTEGIGATSGRPANSDRDQRLLKAAAGSRLPRELFPQELIETPRRTRWRRQQAALRRQSWRPADIRSAASRSACRAVAPALLPPDDHARRRSRRTHGELVGEHQEAERNHPEAEHRQEAEERRKTTSNDADGDSQGARCGIVNSRPKSLDLAAAAARWSGSFVLTVIARGLRLSLPAPAGCRRTLI